MKKSIDDPIPNSVDKPGHADDTGGTGLRPVVHRLEAGATRKRKWRAVPALHGKQDAAGAQAGTPAPPLIS